MRKKNIRLFESHRNNLEAKIVTLEERVNSDELHAANNMPAMEKIVKEIKEVLNQCNRDLQRIDFNIKSSNERHEREKQSIILMITRVLGLYKRLDQPNELILDLPRHAY